MKSKSLGTKKHERSFLLLIVLKEIGNITPVFQSFRSNRESLGNQNSKAARISEISAVFSLS